MGIIIFQLGPPSAPKMPSVIRLGLAGLGFVAVLVGTALLWNVYDDKTREPIAFTDYGKDAVNYIIFVPWLVCAAFFGAAFVMTEHGNLHDVLFVLGFSGLLIMFAGSLNASGAGDTPLAPISFFRMTKLRGVIAFLDDHANTIPDQDDQVSLYQKELGGALLCHMGMITAGLAAAFRLDFKSEGSMLRLIALGVSAISAFVGAVILWSASHLARVGNGVNLSAMYFASSANAGKYNFNGDEQDAATADMIYVITGITMTLVVLIVIGIISNHKGAAIASISIGSLFAFFGILNMLLISAIIKTSYKTDSNIKEDDGDAGRAGLFFCWLSMLASIAAGTLIYMQEKLSAPTKYNSGSDA